MILFSYLLKVFPLGGVAFLESPPRRFLFNMKSIKYTGTLTPTYFNITKYKQLCNLFLAQTDYKTGLINETRFNILTG